MQLLHEKNGLCQVCLSVSYVSRFLIWLLHKCTMYSLNYLLLLWHCFIGNCNSQNSVKEKNYPYLMINCVLITMKTNCNNTFQAKCYLQHVNLDVQFHYIQHESITQDYMTLCLQKDSLLSASSCRDMNRDVLLVTSPDNHISNQIRQNLKLQITGCKAQFKCSDVSAHTKDFLIVKILCQLKKSVAGQSDVYKSILKISGSFTAYVSEKTAFT